MGGKRIDLTGQVFGRLTVVGYSHSKYDAYWKCVCTCGAECVVRGLGLKAGDSTSCGCYHKESASLRFTTHGMVGCPEYCTWKRIRQRCNNNKNPDYPQYGGRGIVVCSEWSSFEQFYADMGPRPSKDHSLDRIDNNGNYCKNNCRWATANEQANNKRSNKALTHKGETRTMSQWAAESGMCYSTLRGRIRRGWDMDRALTEPVGKQNKRGDT